ncbi:hypothetical protein MAR_022858 [Mya arenaria]|uniref:Uncharacterized protein n=1 Tax=Mya arenaria TaxID=6604 RepID=A0ABY7DQ54_MYAAR|nr:hypothetical protein MAR_022858 [Mya arenaria]
MGNTSSLTKGGNSKERNELKLDDILDEVQDVSGWILVIVQTIKQHKQLGKHTDNDEAKNILEGLLKDAFGRLQYYFTVDVYTTCQERNDNGATLLDTLKTTEKGSQLLTKAGLSQANIKRMFESLKDLNNTNNVDIEHLGEQVEKLSTSQSKTISSQKQFSRESSNIDYCGQQQPRSERGNDHEEKKNHSFKRVQYTRTETHSTTKRQERDKLGNYLNTMNRPVKNEADNDKIRDITKWQSVSGNTELLKHSVNSQIAETTMERIPGDRQNTNRSGNRVSENIPGVPKVAVKGLNETNGERNKGLCQTGDKPILTLETKDEGWTQVDVSKEKSTQTTTTNDQTKEIKRLKIQVQLLKDTNEKIEKEISEMKQIQEINSNSANEVAKIYTDIKTQQKELLSLKEENKKLLLRMLTSFVLKMRLIC